MHKGKLKSKFLGCLIGAAIGDGLGAWREGRRIAKKEDIESLAERVEKLAYTDDTHMTIGVVESLIQSRALMESIWPKLLSKTMKLSHGVAMDQGLPGFSG